MAIIKDQLIQYKAADIDESGTTAYYGFVARNGHWYIIKASKASSVTSYRYIKGSSGYSTNWTNRDTLNYDYYNNVF